MSHSTATQVTSATSKASESAIASRNSDRKTVQTPQRKANKRDKLRWRLKDLKNAALTEYKATTAQVKKYLQQLGYSLDLRLTSAWKAIRFELRAEILALVAIKKVFTPTAKFQIGDRVELIQNSDFYLIEAMGGPYIISAIKGNYARLECFEPWIPVDQLILLLDF